MLINFFEVSISFAVFHHNKPLSRVYLIISHDVFRKVYIYPFIPSSFLKPLSFSKYYFIITET